MVRQELRIDENIYNEQSLSLLNLTELRSMARALGVDAPTLLNKTELIKQILDLVYGKYEKKSHKNSGRPSKADFDLERSVQKIRERSLSRNRALRAGIGEFDLGRAKVASPDEDINYFDTHLVETRIVKVRGSKYFISRYGFVDSADDRLLSGELAKRLQLEDMDIVEVVFEGDLFRIITKNGIKVAEDLQEFNIAGESIKGGQKKFFYLSTKEEVKREINKIIDKCAESGTKVYIFSEGDYSGRGVECVKCAEHGDSSVFYKQFHSFLEKCGQSIVNNELFVLLVEDMPQVEKIIGRLDSDIAERIKVHIQNVFTGFAKLGNMIITFRLEEMHSF